jgi:hypothetical protein
MSEEKLCGEEEPDCDSCDEEMCHCEYGLMILQARAELRADLAREG